MGWDYYDDERPIYRTVADRQALAQKHTKKLIKDGYGPLQPAQAKGRKLAASFWGQEWNRNLERYAYYAHRLPRGRSYLTSGQVIDLRVQEGEIHAWVSGSELYETIVRIHPLNKTRWKNLKKACGGKIGSVVDLLKGKLPDEVMKLVIDAKGGLFPEPREIQFDCSCPDDADLCKHVAAAVYGVGVMLDEQPELLFRLRGVDHLELVADAGSALAKEVAAVGEKDGDDLGDLSEIFGVEIEEEPKATKTSAKSVAKPSEGSKSRSRRKSKGAGGE